MPRAVKRLSPEPGADIVHLPGDFGNAGNVLSGRDVPQIA
jgi:hypothetical protein